MISSILKRMPAVGRYFIMGAHDQRRLRSGVALKAMITEGANNSQISARIDVEGTKFRSGSAQGRAGMVNIGGRLP